MKNEESVRASHVRAVERVRTSDDEAEAITPVPANVEGRPGPGRPREGAGSAGDARATAAGCSSVTP